MFMTWHVMQDNYPGNGSNRVIGNRQLYRKGDNVEMKLYEGMIGVELNISTCRSHVYATYG